VSRMARVEREERRTKTRNWSATRKCFEVDIIKREGGVHQRFVVMGGICSIQRRELIVLFFCNI